MPVAGGAFDLAVGIPLGVANAFADNDEFVHPRIEDHLAANERRGKNAESRTAATGAETLVVTV
jgi:hypothetical protein